MLSTMTSIRWLAFRAALSDFEALEFFRLAVNAHPATWDF